MLLRALEWVLESRLDLVNMTWSYHNHRASLENSTSVKYSPLHLGPLSMYTRSLHFAYYFELASVQISKDKDIYGTFESG